MIATVKETINNENGFVIVLALLMLAIITVIGVAATRTSETELQIAQNETMSKLAFYAAEAVAPYVEANPALYGGDNITVGGYINFPNDEAPSATYALSSTLSFNGDVEYLGSSTPPRGSGYAAGKFKAHRYRMTCNGYGPSNSKRQIEMGFYRIGF